MQDNSKRFFRLFNLITFWSEVAGDERLQEYIQPIRLELEKLKKTPPDHKDIAGEKVSISYATLKNTIIASDRKAGILNEFFSRPENSHLRPVFKEVVTEKYDLECTLSAETLTIGEFIKEARTFGAHQTAMALSNIHIS